MNLIGKNAVVVGGTSGIGKGIALRLGLLFVFNICILKFCFFFLNFDFRCDSKNNFQ